MSPIYEIAIFPASDALRRDPDTFLPGLTHLSKVDGMLEGRYGFVEEDTTHCYLALKWETIDQHKTFTKQPDYQILFEELKPVFGGPPQMVHSRFHKDATSAFSAPITSITTIQLKDEAKKDYLKDHIQAEVVPALERLPGVIQDSVVSNETVEDKNRFFVITGLHDGVNAAGDFEDTAILAKLSNLAEVQVRHVRFVKKP